MFKIAYRNLVKNKVSTIINVLGLSTGLACTLMIWFWVKDELNMDKFNEKDSQLFQIVQNQHEENGIRTVEYTAGLLANALSSEMPEVEHACTVLPASWFPNKGIVISGDEHLRARGQFISKDYFKMFSCPFLLGDERRLLSDKQSIAISDELAAKLFGDPAQAIGKTVEWYQQEFNGAYLITAIFKRNPPNVSEKFDILFNFDLFVEKRPGMLRWGNSDPNTFVLLKKESSVSDFNRKIAGFMKDKDKDLNKTLFARRFSDKYLFGKYKDGKQAGGRIEYVRLFSIIALFILAIACINFMNLATAKASRRMKEVGIKKVVGARRRSLIFQYLCESVFMSFISLLVAIALVFSFLPAFNSITGKNLTLAFVASQALPMILITFATGLIAGSYPALYISGSSPAAVLKGKLATSVSELWIRKGLVVFQFSLSIIFIVAVMVVYRQMDYVQSLNLGYNRDHIIHFEIPLSMDEKEIAHAQTFLEEMNGLPGVVNTSTYYHNLTGDHGGIGGVEWEGKNTAKDIEFANLEVGFNFIETVGIQLKEGSSFNKQMKFDDQIIFNEAAIAAMGLKNPVGKTIKFWGQQKQIMGVTKNFHFESLYETVKPCFFQVRPVLPNVLVKVRAGTERQTISAIQGLFKKANPGLAFEYTFMDDDYQALYTSEMRVSILSRYFAGLAILISCLGLFGLVAFTTQKRQKEISIRKIVGASAGNVVVMLSGDFIKLVGIAAAIAFPLVWWMMHQWLSHFAYRINIGVDIFLIAGIATLLITIITISFQSLKAAMANPVNNLRAD